MAESNARMLTVLLRQAGEEQIDVDGALRSRHEILASMAWDYLLNGEITLPNGTKLTATSREWISALKWLFAQVDGKPPRSAGSPAPADEPPPAPVSTPQPAAPDREPERNEAWGDDADIYPEPVSEEESFAALMRADAAATGILEYDAAAARIAYMASLRIHGNIAGMQPKYPSRAPLSTAPSDSQPPQLASADRLRSSSRSVYRERVKRTHRHRDRIGEAQPARVG